jgi:hypothetical protein
LKHWLKWGLAAIVVALVFWVGWGLSVVSRELREKDCANMPAVEVFENVFDHPPPPGITELRAAGRIWLGGRDVYLRFNATDEAIRRLTKGSKRTVDAAGIQECIEGTRMEWRLQGDRRWVRWKERVRWDEVDRIPKPQCYGLLPAAPSATPHITIIVDRSRHLVYVYLFDI